jgi:RimJ/RimL family protein N-acetyltransferase
MADRPDHDLAGWMPARPLQPVVLDGARVRLRPVDPAADAEALFAAGHGDDPDPRQWTFLPYGPFDAAGAMRSWLERVQGSPDPLFLVIEDRAAGPAGMAALMRAAPEHGSIEIGHVWFGAPLQRTPAATEAIFLMARHAFEDLGNRRLEWKCDARNDRSRAAAERFGFTFEGVFRQHMVVKGRNRDTAWFSLLDGEWPAARAAFCAWLDEGNFDAAGRQRRSLASLRAPTLAP